MPHALLAHAAAGLGESAGYERSWAEAWALLDAPAAAPAAPTVLLHLGKAAALAEDWLRVRMVGERYSTARAELRPGPLRGTTCDRNDLAKTGWGKRTFE